MSTQTTSNENKAKTPEEIAKEQAGKVLDIFEKNRSITVTDKQWTDYTNGQQKQIEALAEKLNGQFIKVLETFKPKTESVPSSPAGGAGGNDSMKKVAEYFMSNGLSGEGRWDLNKKEYIDKWWNHYCNTVFRRKEAVTSTNVPGIMYDQEVLLIPGGQSVINIRPFINFKMVEDGADTFHWFKLNKVTFAAITAGTTITASSQTASRIAGTVVERGALQKISFLQTKTLPIDLVNAVNDTFVAGSLHDEASLVLEEAGTATSGDITAANWIRGDTGAEITADDTASVTMKFEGMNRALRLLEAEGYKREQCTAFLHPKQHEELLDNAITTKGAAIAQWNSERLTTGIIEQYLGCRVVVTPAVYTKDNTTNDAYRAIVCVPQALGLASKGNIEVESDRRVEESQIFATGRHYVDAAVIESTGYVRVSTTK